MSGRIGLLLGCGVLACVLFTQALAYQAGYHRTLGAPLLRVPVRGQMHGLYAPWQGMQWAWQWGSSAPRVMQQAGMLALLPVTFAGLVWRWQRRGTGGPPPMEGHGTTHWATRRDL